MPGRKVKESATRMENITSIMVLQKHVYGADTRFSTMPVPLVNNPMGGCLGVIRRGSYQSSYEYIRLEYETVSYLLPYI